MKVYAIVKFNTSHPAGRLEDVFTTPEAAKKRIKELQGDDKKYVSTFGDEPTRYEMKVCPVPGADPTAEKEAPALQLIKKETVEKDGCTFDAYEIGSCKARVMHRTGHNAGFAVFPNNSQRPTVEGGLISADRLVVKAGFWGDMTPEEFRTRVAEYEETLKVAKILNEKFGRGEGNVKL